MDQIDTDLMFVAGVIILILAVPACLSAWSDRQWPRIGTLMLLSGAGAIAFAVVQMPGVYHPLMFPDLLIEVIGRYKN